jgi:glycosyltransferase involved in cell wall biosynthesis
MKSMSENSRDTFSSSEIVDVSVIIPARNRPGDLLRCLEALNQQDYPRARFEVLVCDDGSEETLQPIVDRMKNERLNVRLVRQPPRGPAAARNLGIRYALGSVIAMTDSDTIPDPAWLRKLCESLKSDPACVGVEGHVSSGEDEEADPLVEGPVNRNGGVYLTCNCAYLRQALYEIGGFDETFPYPAYEDTDLAARALRIGEIAWQPDAIVMHPTRPLTLRTVLKKLRHWEYVMIMGCRYGYLGWKQYPVSHPRLRVAALATIALPLAKLKAACRWAMRRPQSAVKLALFGLIESAGAFCIVVPKALFSRNLGISRDNYLTPTNGGTRRPTQQPQDIGSSVPCQP